MSCKKCGSNIDMHGFCRDNSCPFYDWKQEVELADLQNLQTVDVLLKYPGCRRANLARSMIEKELQVSFGVRGVLDALVKDVASAQATEANNGGLSSQLLFLNRRGMTDEAVLTHIQEATDA